MHESDKDIENYINAINVENHSPMDVNCIKYNIPKYTSQKLCEIIVCDRFLGIYKELSVLCMEELASRRIAGDNYDFESYIEKSYNELPKLDFSIQSIPDVGNFLRKLINNKVVR